MGREGGRMGMRDDFQILSLPIVHRVQKQQMPECKMQTKFLYLSLLLAFPSHCANRAVVAHKQCTRSS